MVSVMDLPGAIQALERGLMAEAQGHATNMVKTHVEWDGSTLHAIGAAFPSEGFVGTKTWAHTEGGATPLLILFDSHNGSLKAVIEAFALGQMRTASASGVATKWLAAEDSTEFGMIGTGKQALGASGRGGRGSSHPPHPDFRPQPRAPGGFCWDGSGRSSASPRSRPPASRRRATALTS